MINLPSHHKSALCWSLAGSTVVLLLIVMMNLSKPAEKKQLEKSPLNFEVAKVEQPKKVEKKQPKKNKQNKQPPVPMVDLNSDLSGIDFNLTSFAVGNLGVADSLIGDTSNVVMTGDTVDIAPAPVTRAELEYPPRASLKEIEGYVVLSLLINSEGKVVEARVIEASPEGIFENAAIRSVKRWNFKPAYFNGKPVTSWANQTIRFEMG